MNVNHSKLNAEYKKYRDLANREQAKIEAIGKNRLSLADIHIVNARNQYDATADALACVLNSLEGEQPEKKEKVR